MTLSMPWTLALAWMAGLSIPAVALAFGTGGLGFWQFSAWAERTSNPASQFVGMLLDFFPEAILLGALAASGSNMVYLLAGLIALQNMPEGFAAYEDIAPHAHSESNSFPAIGAICGFLLGLVGTMLIH